VMAAADKNHDKRLSLQELKAAIERGE
jgi:hypothetical protein